MRRPTALGWMDVDLSCGLRRAAKALAGVLTLLAISGPAAAAEPGHLIGVTDLLKSALSDPNGGACRTLEALSVDVGALRASL